MTTEQLLVESWRSLPEELQREALEFVQSLLRKEQLNTFDFNEVKRQLPPPELVGKVKILGDMVAPIVSEEDWECLK